MPEIGRYKKIPRPESIDYFIKLTRNHNAVSNVEKIADYVFRIKRNNKPSINVFLTNIYIVGEADVHEIISSNSQISCIVTVSNWNSYTEDAKRLCKDLGIGLFVVSEYYGALHYAGRKFIDYKPPKRN